MVDSFSAPSLSATARRVSVPPITKLMQTALANPHLISLAAGFVDQASLPTDLVAEAVEELRSDPREFRKALQYGTTMGSLELRELFISRVEREEGVAPGSWKELVKQTVITTGSQQLLSLICEALLDPGDIVLVEAPTYFVFIEVLKLRGVRAIGVATDEGGMRLDSLEDRLNEIEQRGELHRVKLVYTISEHGNPTGLSLAAERRAPLVEIVQRWSKKSHPIFILEDAAYRGVTFGSEPEPPSVWKYDESKETVILARTASKTFSPGIKVGFGILPKSLLEAVSGLKGNGDFGSSNWCHCLLARIMAKPQFDQHVARVRETYQQKCAVMVQAIETHLAPLDPSIHWNRPRGGIYVWLSLPTGVDAGADGGYFHLCQSRGVIYVPGQLAYPSEPDPPPRHKIRLSYGVCQEADIVEGVRRMAEALEDWRASSRSA